MPGIFFMVRACERSGLSGPKFAELAGVNYQTFASWRSQHGTQPPSRRRATPAATGPAWVEAELRPDSGEGLTVLLPGGACVHSMPGIFLLHYLRLGQLRFQRLRFQLGT